MAYVKSYHGPLAELLTLFCSWLQAKKDHARKAAKGSRRPKGMHHLHQTSAFICSKCSQWYESSIDVAQDVNDLNLE